MKLEIGSEKRFFDFIKNLNEKDKIGLISHTDLDGIVAAKVINMVIKADIVKFLSYSELNMELIKEIKKNKINKVIFSDLYIENLDFIKELEKFASILILDHHVAKTDLNSDKTIFIKGEEGYCAGYLCYELFSKLQDIEKIDWLVVCASISDFCNVKNSEWIKKVYEKYGEKFTDGMRRLGFDESDLGKSKFYDLQWKLD